MAGDIVRRDELIGATLPLGGSTIDLSGYATTGLRIALIGPSGTGKTNAACVIAEALSKQGWTAVMVSPEGELEKLYPVVARDADHLRTMLIERKHPLIIAVARDAAEFIPIGTVIRDVCDEYRLPTLLAVDEAQVFSSSALSKGASAVAEASRLINTLIERGRKRRIDVLITSLRFQGTVHRSIFANKNFTLISKQEPEDWPAISRQFRESNIEYKDVAALAPGEFLCVNNRGVERVRLQLADALAEVAPKAVAPVPSIPSTFTQWCRAMSRIKTSTLQSLDDPTVELLSSLAGLSAQQVLDGRRALEDELAVRS